MVVPDRVQRSSRNGAENKLARFPGDQLSSQRLAKWEENRGCQGCGGHVFELCGRCCPSVPVGKSQPTRRGNTGAGEDTTPHTRWGTGDNARLLRQRGVG